MDKLDIGNKLIVVGIILYIGAVPLYIVSAMIWEIASIGFVIVCSSIITGITCIIIGGKWAKKSRGYWMVLLGLILILSGLFLEAFNISANILGLTMYIPYPTSLVTLGIGITVAIIGGLMKE
jgi:hypothetical protein